MADYKVHIQGQLTGFEELDQIEAKIKSLQNSKVNVQVGVDSSGFNQTMKQYTSAGSKAGKAYQTAIQKQLSSSKIKYDFETGKFNANLSKMQSQIGKYEGQQGKQITSATKAITQYNAELQKLQNHYSGKNVLDDKALDKSVKRITKSGDTFKNAMTQIQNEMSKTLDLGVAERSANRVTSYMKTNTKALRNYGVELRELESRYKGITTQAEKLDLDSQFKGIQSEISAKGLTGKSWIDELGRGFKQIGQFAMTYGVIQRVGMQAGSEIVNAVKDVNAAQIELRKVSNAPTSELNAYWDDATESAKKYGATISDVISSTADWSRLGYNLEDAKKLSDATTLMQKVGDNMTQESSAQGIISTLRGFNMDASEVAKITDSVNEIANTQPIDTAGIFEGLSRSASSMSAANNTLEQTISLITAANSVVQDPASVGTAFKTISMRIRGATTELEEAGLETDGMAESTAKLRQEIQALSGVDIMKDANTFKSTYSIMDELSTKWKDLTDIQQASITELIAGKRQGNIVSALMSNFDIARDTLNTAMNESSGSAERELANYQKGKYIYLYVQKCA